MKPLLTQVDYGNFQEYGGDLYDDASIVYDSASVYYGGAAGGTGKAYLSSVLDIKTALQIQDIKPQGEVIY